MFIKHLLTVSPSRAFHNTLIGEFLDTLVLTVQLLNEVKQKGPYADIRIPFAQLEQVFIASFCQRKAQNTHLGHHRLCGYSEEISRLHYVIEKINSRERTSGRTTALYRVGQLGARSLSAVRNQEASARGRLVKH